MWLIAITTSVPKFKGMFMARVSVSPCAKGLMITSICSGLSKGTKHKL